MSDLRGTGRVAPTSPVQNSRLKSGPEHQVTSAAMAREYPRQTVLLEGALPATDIVGMDFQKAPLRFVALDELQVNIDQGPHIGMSDTTLAVTGH